MLYEEFLELAKGSMQNRIYVGKGSFSDYKERVAEFKKEKSGIMKQYNLTESELFVMFMMVIKNCDDIQEQFFSPEKSNTFTRECISVFDSFLEKIPRSTSHVFYRVDKSQRAENFEKKAIFEFPQYLTASTNSTAFKNFQTGVKLIINKRAIGETKAHEVFKICNVNNECQVNFERNSRFRIDTVDRKNKIVELTEL